MIEIIIIIRAIKTNAVFHGKLESESNINSGIYVLVPCHFEDNLILDTVNFYNGLCKTYVNLNIIFITGEEFREKDSYKRIKSVLKNSKSCIKVVKNTNLKNNKSAKLNYAIQCLYRQGVSLDSYIGVYDFDARPSINTITQVEVNAKNNLNVILQEVPLTLMGIDNTSMFCRCFSIWHLRRSLGIEGVTLSHTKKRKLTYLMGSGMYLSLETILNLKGFPDNDDIEMGYKLVRQCADEIILNTNNFTKVTKTIKGLFLQYVKIYDGVFSYPRVAKKDNYKLNLIRELIVRCRIYSDALLEPVEAMLLIFLFISQNYLQCFLIYLLLECMYVIYFELARKNLEFKIKKSDFLYFPMIGFLNIFFRLIVVITYPFYKGKLNDLQMESTKK